MAAFEVLPSTTEARALMDTMASGEEGVIGLDWGEVAFFWLREAGIVVG